MIGDQSPVRSSSQSCKLLGQAHRLLGMSAAKEAANLPTRAKKHLVRKIVLRLPDLDHAETSVLNDLSSPRSRREHQAKVGGRFRYEWTNDKGAGFHITGEYLALEPCDKIVHVERMHLPDPTPDNNIETRFQADGDGTLMTMRMTLPDAKIRAEMLATGMERGMEASYVRLETKFI